MHIKLTNGAPVKYTLGKLRRDNPNTSFPKNIPDELLASYDVYPYTLDARPEYNPLTQTCDEHEFVKDDQGAWLRNWIVRDIPIEDASKRVRSRRDSLLRETDWIVTKAYDTGEAVPSEWATYRQALRDVTSQEGFPYSVAWPTKP